MALLPRWWSNKVQAQTAESWRRHYRTLNRRDANKPELTLVHVPEDLDVYFGPPSVYISLSQGEFYSNFYFKMTMVSLISVFHFSRIREHISK